MGAVDFGQTYVKPKVGNPKDGCLVTDFDIEDFDIEDFDIVDFDIFV